MSRAEVLACAGAPSREAADGETRVMAYQQDRVWAGTFSSCTANVILAGGKVTRVSYSSTTRGPRNACGPILAGCAR